MLSVWMDDELGRVIEGETKEAQQDTKEMSTF